VCAMEEQVVIMSLSIKILPQFADTEPSGQSEQPAQFVHNIHLGWFKLIVIPSKPHICLEVVHERDAITIANNGSIYSDPETWRCSFYRRLSLYCEWVENLYSSSYELPPLLCAPT